MLELNEAHDMCIHYADVGVFYTGRDWASQGNVVRWNYIHDVAIKGGSGAQAIYLDDCDSGETVVGNIVHRCGNRGVLLGGGGDNTFRGNIFIDQPIGIHVDVRGPRGIVFDRPESWNLLAKCQELGYQSPLWQERYPRLARTMDENPLQPMGNSMRDNIMIGCQKPFDLRKEVDPTWLDRANNSEWPLTEFSDLFAGEPPGKLNLTKLPSVWQRVSGFEPIPFDQIGPVNRGAKVTEHVQGVASMNRIVLLAGLFLVTLQSRAAEPQQLTDVAYGSTRGNVLDFYPAKSDKPTPVVLYIHGGGWRGGDKKTNPQAVSRQGHLGRRHQLPLRAERRGGEGRAAGEGAAGRRGPRTAVRPLQGRRMEPRQEAHRRHRRFRRCLHVAVAGLSRRHGRSSRATTPSRAKSTRSTAPPSTVRKSRSIRRNCASGCRTTVTAPTPSGCRAFRA